MIKSCLINLELVLDFNSLVLSIIKNEHPDINTNFIQVQENPLKFLKQLPILMANLSVLKPQIGAIETIEYLQSQGILTHIFSNLDNDIISVIANNMPYLNITKEITQLIQQVQEPLIIDSKLQLCENYQAKKFKVALLKNYNLKDKEYWENIMQNKDTQILYVQSLEEFPWNYFKLQGQPQFQDPQFKVSMLPNAATKYWNKYLQLEPINITSQVIHGYNRGGTMLGIPTANMCITNEIQEQIKNLIPGVYAGFCCLNQQKYGGVLSIGYNPYFHNRNKTLEVYLFGEFKEDFYDSELDLQILYFLRPESDFRCFDHLIKFINSDKIFAKQLLNL